MVECHLAKVKVAGSSPVSRSQNCAAGHSMCGILEQNVQDTWTMGEKPSVLVSCFVEWQALNLSTMI